jgi:DNA repair protein SbcD/Mre11
VRLVHFSDLHLGFRQYQRQTPAGINQREADVAAAFRAAVDRTIELRPDLVVLGGDIFHQVRPSNPAILHAFNQFARLTNSLPDALVVMVAGNHDTPRATETGCILRLFIPLGIHVVDAEPRRLFFPERDLSILAIPDLPGPGISMKPDPGARRNVLLVHGEVAGVVHRRPLEERPAMEIAHEDLNAGSWDYIALGHYHVFREIAPNAFYSGSIEYTSSNPWGELVEQEELGVPGKGLVEFDLESGKHTFHALPGIRAFVDLPAFSARGMTAVDLDAAIRTAVESCAGGIDEKVVRLVVRDVPRHIARELDHVALRGYRRRALHFHLDTRRPEILRPDRSHTHGHGAPGRRASLAETVRDKLRTRLIDARIDRDALVALGLHYLAQAEATAPGIMEPEA